MALVSGMIFSIRLLLQAQPSVMPFPVFLSKIGNWGATQVLQPLLFRQVFIDPLGSLFADQHLPYLLLSISQAISCFLNVVVPGH